MLPARHSDAKLPPATILTACTAAYHTMAFRHIPSSYRKKPLAQLVHGTRICCSPSPGEHRYRDEPVLVAVEPFVTSSEISWFTDVQTRRHGERRPAAGQHPATPPP